MSKLLIAGAKGFATELLAAVLQAEDGTEVTFFDDVSTDVPDSLFDRYPVIRNEAAAKKYFANVDDRFALGIGNPDLRRQFFDRFVSLGGKPQSVISPFARIGQLANEIGAGCTILANAVIEANNRIGKGTLIHVGALISHDVLIGDFCEISPHANLLGNATVGTGCRIGTGSILLPRVIVEAGATVGAGAVVTKDVPSQTTVVGIPARQL